MVFWEISSQSLENRKVNKTFGPLLVIKAKRRRVQPLFGEIFSDSLKWNYVFFCVESKLCLWFNCYTHYTVSYYLFTCLHSKHTWGYSVCTVCDVNHASEDVQCMSLHPPENSTLTEWIVFWTFLYALHLAQSPVHGSCSLLFFFEWIKKRMSYFQATFLSLLPRLCLDSWFPQVKNLVTKIYLHNHHQIDSELMKQMHWKKFFERIVLGKKKLFLI